MSELKTAILIAVGGVADRLDLAERTIWKLLASEKIPSPVRLGGSVRWNEAELSRWIEAGCPARDHWEAMKREIGGAE